MKKLQLTTKFASAILLAGLFMVTSCNKNLDTLPALNPGTPSISSSNSIAKILGQPFATYDTMFYRLVVRSTLLPLLDDSSKRFTINAVDSTGMKIFVNRASGGAIPLNAPNSVFFNFIDNLLPVATATAIVQYNIIGQLLPTSAIASRFPNVPYATQIQLDPLNNPFLRMTTTYAKNSAGNISYVNNIPSFGQNDQLASNGIIHHTYTVVTPPTPIPGFNPPNTPPNTPPFLREMIASKPMLSYFRQALIRADSGQIVKAGNDSINFLNYFMGYAVLNQTVIAPSDAAFQTFIFSIVYGKSLQAGLTPAAANAAATSAVAAGPAFLMSNYVSTTQVRGIVAYHMLASDFTGSFKPDIRVFSVNVPTAPALVKTLVNGSFGPHPGVRAVATFTGPVATSVTFTGFSALTGGAPFTDIPANVIDKDNNAINGILHIIDRVLVPLPL